MFTSISKYIIFQNRPQKELDKSISEFYKTLCFNRIKHVFHMELKASLTQCRLSHVRKKELFIKYEIMLYMYTSGGFD